MAQQNVEFNIGANVTGMEAIATLINRVGALEAETKKLASANAALSSSTDTVIKNGTRYNNALDAQSKQLRNARQGTQQLGMQINDFATSVSTGASPIQAFNQQIGQVGYAMSMMGGAAGKVGAFLAGPWGAAVTIAVAALGPLIGKLWDFVNGAREVNSALDETVRRYRSIMSEQNRLVNSQAGLNDLFKERSRLESIISTKGKRDANGRLMFVYKEQQALEALNKQINESQAAIFYERVGRAKQTSARAEASMRSSGGAGAMKGGGAGRAASVKDPFSAQQYMDAKRREWAMQDDKFWSEQSDKQEQRTIDGAIALQDQLRVLAEVNKDAYIKPIDDALNELSRSYANIGNTVAGAFKGMLTGATSWKDGMKGIINSVIDELWRLYVVQQIVGLIGNALGGIGLPIPNIAGKRANGGHVSGNRPYLVGENGPELMVPGGSGTIIPNRNLGMGGAGGSGMTINVDARGASDPAAVRAQVQQGILEAAPAIIAAAEARTVQGMRRPRLGGAMQ